jgi:hypothetical protein
MVPLTVAACCAGGTGACNEGSVTHSCADAKRLADDSCIHCLASGGHVSGT